MAASLAQRCAPGREPESEAPGRRRHLRGRSLVRASVPRPRPSSAVGGECGRDSRPRHLPDFANSPDFLSSAPDTPKESSELRARAVWFLLVVTLGKEPGARGSNRVKVSDMQRNVT